MLQKILLLVLISSTTAISGTIEEIKQSEKPYETLERYFDIASDEISLNDFYSENELDLINCTYASKSSSLLDYNVYTFDAVIRGIPSHGPLFPGTEDKLVKLISSYKASSTIRNAMLYVFKKSKTEIAQTLYIHYDGTVGAPVNPKETSYFRKSGELIFAKYVLHNRTSGEMNNEAHEYGYCWE